MQIFAAKSLELPRPVFSCGTCSLAWTAAVDTSLASAYPPHGCQNHLQNKEVQSPSFPAQNPPVAPLGLVLFGGPGSLLRIWGVQKTLTPGGKRCILSKAYLRITYECLRLHWFSRVALASTRLTSYPLLFFHTFLLWPYGIISSVPYTLPVLFPLPGMPSHFSHPRHSLLSCTQPKHRLFCSLPKPLQADTDILASLTFSSPVLYSTVIVSFLKRL